MCDEFTASTEQQALDRRGLTRREFAAMGTALALAGCASQATGNPDDLTEGMVAFQTPDGLADAFFVHPPKGKHPGVVMWPDVAGLRDAMKIMARRLARAGYAVLLVNPYYRGAHAPVLTSLAQWRTDEGQAKLKPLIAAITPQGTVRDAMAFVGFLDGQDAVDPARGIGTNGYCMGGPYTVRTAAAVPRRVKAVACFHGADLVTDSPDSPHRLIGSTDASYLFAIARNDDARSPGDKDALKAAAAAAHRPAEIEVYPADHGWCALDAPVYDQAQADRAWGRMLALFSKL